MPDDKNLFLEKDGLRGLVPTSDNGRADVAYAAWLEGIEAETDPELHIALARSSDPRYRRFLEMIGKPNKQGLRIQTMAKQCGIDLAEFQQWYGKESVQMAIGIAQRKARFVVADMAGDALTRSEFCERCDGLGWVIADPAKLPADTPGMRMVGMQTKETPGPEGEPVASEVPMFGRTCPKCQGKMRVDEPGDEHARDKILEIAGLTQKGGKGGVQIVQNFGGAGHTSAVNGSLGVLTVDVSAEPMDSEVPEDGN